VAVVRVVAPQPAAPGKAACTWAVSAASAPAASHKEVRGKAVRWGKAQAVSVEPPVSADRAASVRAVPAATAESLAPVARAPPVATGALAGKEAKAEAAADCPARISWTTATPAPSTAAIQAACSCAQRAARWIPRSRPRCYDSLAFLYETEPLVQTGVAPGTIDVVAVAGITGRVVGPDGLGLSNVSVTVLGHPEYGATLTDATGRYILAVNASHRLTLDLQAAGFIRAQRAVEAPMQQIAHAADVMLSVAGSRTRRSLTYRR
jgi:hypothetical protein